MRCQSHGTRRSVEQIQAPHQSRRPCQCRSAPRGHRPMQISASPPGLRQQHQRRDAARLGTAGQQVEDKVHRWCQVEIQDVFFSLHAAKTRTATEIVRCWLSMSAWQRHLHSVGCAELLCCTLQQQKNGSLQDGDSRSAGQGPMSRRSRTLLGRLRRRARASCPYATRQACALDCPPCAVTWPQSSHSTACSRSRKNSGSPPSGDQAVWA